MTHTEQDHKEPERTFTAFAGERMIAAGSVEEMLRATKAHLDRGERASARGRGAAGNAPPQVLIFEDQTGAQVDFDFRGSVEDVLARIPAHPLFAPPAPHAGPGRPRLGVVSREVTLLPRHWEWLEQQPNGSSAALRRLVEEAGRQEPERERARRAAAAASRFMTAMAGDRPGYEEASRALFAADWPRLRRLVRRWPKDIRGHLERLVHGI
jgi:hypothetical protein